MIPVTKYNGEAVAVLGLGRSGLTAARALKAGGATPICWDDNEDSLSAADEEGFLIANLHSETVWQEHDFKALILSPGIPHLYPEPNPVVKLAWGHGVPVDNDVSLFFAAITQGSGAPWPAVIAITGSNGKSTTTALIAHILEAAGCPVQMGGNIGRGVLDLDPPEQDTIYVLELSSYQTELARTLSPAVAVFLNFSPDHFDRHGGRGGYFAAKKRLFENSENFQVIGVDEDEGRFLANSFQYDMAHDLVSMDEKYFEFLTDDNRGKLIAISATKSLREYFESIFIEDGNLVWWMAGNNIAEVPLNKEELSSLKGDHNLQNICAAFAVCAPYGLSADEICASLKTFPGLPHRMEHVGSIGSVSFVNDSKATNVEAAAKALAAFDNIYWIAGGQGKDGGLEGLRDYIPNIKKAYLIGETADQFASLLGDRPLEQSGTMQVALQSAARDAMAAGEKAVVLLAPACASFDQFPSFEHRGDAFRKQALALISKDHS